MGGRVNKVEWQALQWFRTSHTGRTVQRFVDAKVLEAREVYENMHASEEQRLLLQAYKKARVILYDVNIKEID